MHGFNTVTFTSYRIRPSKKHEPPRPANDRRRPNATRANQHNGRCRPANTHNAPPVSPTPAAHWRNTRPRIKGGRGGSPGWDLGGYSYYVFISFTCSFVLVVKELLLTVASAPERIGQLEGVCITILTHFSVYSVVYNIVA